MKDNDTIKTTNDIWFERQVDALRQMKAPVVPDVTDAVMQKISAMPSPIVTMRQRRRKVTVASSVIAACLAGIAIIPFWLSPGNLHAANQQDQELSSRLFDIYDHCHNIDENMTVESAAYYDNPVSNFF